MSAEFTTDKPIYVQILDFCMNAIAGGEWLPQGRVPSVKELSVTMGVNPRTVMRAYEELALRGIIFQRRGLGFFVADRAVEEVRAIRRLEFEQTVLPAFIARLRRDRYPVSLVIEALQALGPRQND